MSRRAFFAGTRPGEQVELASPSSDEVSAQSARAARFELPALYFRDDCFAAYFSVSASRLREVMPSDRLHPVTLGGDRALLAIVAFNYLETTIGPYGEVGVVAPVVHGLRPPPLLPALLETRYPGFGALVLHLPVTTTLARDAGRGLWGYTKFVAAMQFERTPEDQRCRVEESGRHLLTLRVQRRGRIARDVRPLVTYSVLDGELIKTVIPHRALLRARLGGGGGQLELGDHPVAREIAALDPSPRPLLTRDYVERAAILPRGEVVERGVRALDGYHGDERARAAALRAS